MPPQQQQPLEMSDAEMRALQAYANQRGITTEQAATELARQTIERRYVRRKQQPAQVLPFKPRA